MATIDFSDWDDVEAASDPARIKNGKYICKIRDVKIRYTKKKEQEMLVFFIDVAEGEYKNYFGDMYDRVSARFPEYKYPCCYYQLTGRERELENSGFFRSKLKALIQLIEKCNPGFDWKETGFETAALKGKLIGFKIENKEVEFNGKTLIRTEATLPLSLDEARQPVKEDKKTSPEKKSEEDFFNAKDIPDSDLPF